MNSQSRPCRVAQLAPAVLCPTPFSVLSQEAETARRPSALNATHTQNQSGLSGCAARARFPPPTPSASGPTTRTPHAVRPHSTPLQVTKPRVALPGRELVSGSSRQRFSHALTTLQSALVRRSRHRPPPVPTQRHAPDLTGVAWCAARARCPPPTPSASCHGRRHRQPPVPTQRHSINSIRVAFKVSSCARPLPHFSVSSEADIARPLAPRDADEGGLKFAAPPATSHTFSVWSSGRGDRQLSVRTSRHAVDRIGVAFEGAQLAPALHVPHLQRLVIGRRDRQPSIRRDTLRRDRTEWPSQVHRSRPLSASHTFSVLSSDADTATCPSALHRHAVEPHQSGLAGCAARARSPAPTPLRSRPDERNGQPPSRLTATPRTASLWPSRCGSKGSREV